MSIIGRQELERLKGDFYERLWAAQETLCGEVIAGLGGRQLLVERKFKGDDGEYHLHQITVSVTGAHLGQENDLILEGTYVHPTTGHTVPTEV